MSLKKKISRLAIITVGAGLSASASNWAMAADASSTDGWTGPYVGLLAGVEFADNTWSTTALGLNNFVGVDPTSAHKRLNSAGGRFGAFGGWNFPVAPNLVASLEGDFAGISDSRKSETGIPGVTYNFPSMGITGVASTDSVSATQKWDGGVRARLGYVIDPKLMVYGTGGVAFQKSEFSANCPSSTNTASFCGVPESQTLNKIVTGWTIGAGVEGKISDRWTARLEYRYADFGSRNFNFFTGTNSGVDTVSARVKSESHLVTIGVSYALFGKEETAVAQNSGPAPMAAPMATPAAPTPPPAPQAQENFLVFFDFDKSSLTVDAKKVVNEAANYAKSNGKVVISATGHTDTMGTAAYNMALSERRAQAVRDALVKLGIPAREINIHWKGKSEPLIQTGDGVKEPQNRRVEIVLE